MLTPATLPKKFKPHVLGATPATEQVKRELDSCLAQSRQRDLKQGYIFEAGDWILKLPRPGDILTPDTHLYRVRKAVKIRRYLDRHGLSDQFVVPQKWLYWNEREQRFYVASAKLKLATNTVASPATEEARACFIEESLRHGGQAGLLRQSPTLRDISVVQAKALAELAFLGYTDQSYNNVFFTPEGKIAIVDTEPLKRTFKKKVNTLIRKIFLADMSSITTLQAFTGTSKLKTYCRDPLARRAIEQVERKHALWQAAKIITRIVLAVIALSLLPTILPLIPLVPVVVSKFLLITFFAQKVIEGTFNLLALSRVWNMSQAGLTGLRQLSGLEQMGYL